MSEIGLVLNGVFRKWWRTLLLLAAIFVAFLIYSVLGSFQKALTAGIDVAAANRLVTINKINFTQPIPYPYFEKVKGLEHVTGVAHANWVGCYFQNPRNQFACFAVSPQEYLDVYPDVIVDPAERAAWLADKGGLLVGESLAGRFKWKVGDVVPLKSNIFTRKDGEEFWKFTIRGIFKGEDQFTDTTYAIFPYENFREGSAFGGESLGWLIVTTDSPDNNQAVIEAIDSQFANSPAETETNTEAAFGRAFLAQVGDIGFVIVLVTTAAFVTILMVVGNSMIMAIRERTKEFAVMKTLGFAGPRIFRMVLLESLALSLIGGVLGMLAGMGLVAMLAPSLRGFLPSFALTWDVAALGLAIMIVLGLVTGGLPALNAMRVNIVNALQRG